MDPFLPQEPTPQHMATFERELYRLLRAVGRRIMAWALPHMEPACAEERPSRLWGKAQAARRRRTHRTTMATLCGPVVGWRRLYEPLAPRARAIPPVERR